MMRPSALAAALLVAFALAPPVVTQSTSDNSAVALAYLNTLYQFDFERLGSQLAVDAVFEDPTAVSFTGAELRYEGRAAILEGFEAGAAATRNAGFDVLHQFDSGEHVVLTLLYRTELDGQAAGRPGAWIPVEVPAVTILRIDGGLVTHHVDHVDYDELLRQISAFENRAP